MASKLRLYFSKAKDNHNDENNDMYCVVWPFLFLSIIIIFFLILRHVLCYYLQLLWIEQVIKGSYILYILALLFLVFQKAIKF